MIDYFRALSASLQAAAHGERRTLIAQAEKDFQISRPQVYRRLHAAGWRSGRKLRADKGDSRLTDDEARKLAGMMHVTTRNNGKRLMSMRTALSIAHANGEIACDISADSVHRIMRRRGLHPDQLANPGPHVPLQSLHPNHVWQFDVSVCVLYYLDVGGLAAIDEKQYYRNKPQNLKRIADKRVLRYLITDHYSGAFYVHYILAAGENQDNLFEFLMDAFTRREHAKDPMHGVPLCLVWDAGAANQSYLIKNLLDRLDVKHWAHTPGNPRAKGQVECTHNIVECDFESRLVFKDVGDIETLNRKAHTWMRAYNANEIHKRHQTTRYGLWQTIRAEELRECPDLELCRSLLSTKPQPRRVRGDLSISYKVKGYDTLDYSVAHVPHIRVGEAVDVTVNPYLAPNVTVAVCDTRGVEATFECRPIAKTAAGFRADAPVIGEEFRAARDTDVDRARKHILKAAYGADTLDEAERRRNKHEPAYAGIDAISYLEHQTVVDFMHRKGSELPIERPRVVPKPMSVTQALITITRTLRRALTSDELAAFKATHPDGITEEALQAWISADRQRQEDAAR